MLVALVAVPSVAVLGEGLRLYASFDGAPPPDYAFGVTSPRHVDGEAAIVQGRVDGAIRLPADERSTALTFAGPGNLQRSRGTIALWVRPTWQGAANQPQEQHHRFVFSTSGFRVFWNRDHGALEVMTGTNRGDGWRWSYAPSASVRDWQAGEWHHVAVRWDGEAQTKALFIDGALAGEAESEYIAFRDTPRDFEFGLAWRAPGDYDEFATWERTLSDEEIRSLAEEPDAAAATLGAQDLPPEPEWPIRVGMHCWTNHFADAIVAPGDEVALTIPVANHGDQAQAAHFTFTLLDFHLQPQQTIERDVDLAPGAEDTIDLVVSSDRLGIFKLKCDVRCGEFEGSRDVASFGVVPEPEHNEPIEDSYFGGHPEQTRDYIPQAARYGLKWARCHDMIQGTRWHRVQPAPDEWAFRGAQTITRCVENGMHVLGVFLKPPEWAAESHAHPPRDMDDYERYVRRTMEHFGDRIRHWEIWNEPHHGGFFKGSAEEYVALARTTYRVAKQVDPDCVIVGGGGLSDRAPQFAKEAMNAGLLEYCDWLSYHNYISADAPPEQALEPVRWFRDLLAEHGHPEMPLICSEGGLTDTTWLEGLALPELPPERVRPPMTWRQGARRIVQVAALEMAAGVRQRFYYFMKSPPRPRAYYGYSALEVTGAPRPKLMAWMAMERALRGCRHALTVDEGPVHAEIFEGEDRAVAVAWADDGAEAAIASLPPTARVIDLMGNELPLVEPLTVTDEPIYVTLDSVSREDLARALRN